MTSILTNIRVTEDILHLIIVEVAGLRKSLKALSCVSHHMRFLCLPVLFSRCVYFQRKNETMPPASIRPYIRHVVCHYANLEGLSLEDDPQLLPSIQSVEFVNAPGGIPWTTIKACLSHPNITSISFQPFALWSNITPFPESEARTFQNTLTKLSYMPHTWRELRSGLDRTDLAAEFALEAHCLAALVLQMCSSAQSLILPFETSPLDRMAQLSWPRLHELSLSGRYVSSDQRYLLLNLLSDIPTRLPSLRRLCINVAQIPKCSRAPIMERNPSSTGCHRLRSLTLSYPDPADAIFSVRAPDLTHLSLRDSPRYYYHIYQCGGAHTGDWVAPILSSSECLAILTRLEAPTLESIELVYQADDEEDDLLRYVTSFYPGLSQIELHRYRLRDDDEVPYIRIAHHLAAVKWLQIVRLNLDFHETTGPLCVNDEIVNVWKRLYLRVGREMLPIFLAACPLLTHLELLFHYDDCSIWNDFIPDGDNPARVIYQYWESDRKDSDNLPFYPRLRG